MVAIYQADVGQRRQEFAIDIRSGAVGEFLDLLKPIEEDKRRRDVVA